MPEDKLDLILDMQKEQTTIMTLVKEKTIRIESKLEQLNGTVKKHETILYGSPGDFSNPGLISTVIDNKKGVSGLGKRVDDLKGKFWMFVTGVFAFVQLVIKGLMEMIK